MRTQGCTAYKGRRGSGIGRDEHKSLGVIHGDIEVQVKVDSVDHSIIDMIDKVEYIFLLAL